MNTESPTRVQPTVMKREFIYERARSRQGERSVGRGALAGNGGIEGVYGVSLVPALIGK